MTVRTAWAATCLCAGFGAALGADAVPAPRDLEIPPSPAPAVDREGLERGEWRAEDTADPAALRLVQPASHARNQMLFVEYTGGTAGKVVLKRFTGLAAAEQGTLRTWVYCRLQQPPTVSLALCTGENYVWQETETVRLKEGWNELRFDLAGTKWKSTASTWRHSAALGNREDVRMLAFVIHNGPTGGLLYLDALQLDRSDKAGLEALIRKLGAEEFEEREAATRDLLRVGPPASEALREALDSPDAEVATRVRQVLERLGDARKAEPGPESPNGVNVWTDDRRR